MKMVIGLWGHGECESRGRAESFHPSRSPPSDTAILTSSFAAVGRKRALRRRPAGEKTWAMDAGPSNSAGRSPESSESHTDDGVVGVRMVYVRLFGYRVPHLKAQL